MFWRRGGESVKGGFYWCRSSWRLEVVSGASGVLPGGAESRYVRVPVILMIPAALAISVVFVVFLPFIGFAILGQGLYAHARTAVQRGIGNEPELVADERRNQPLN